MTNARVPICPGILLALAGWMLPASTSAAGAAEVTGEAAPGMILKLSESIANGHLLLEVRPRYAEITETVKPEKTAVWTVRTTLGWQTAPFHDLRLTAQYIYTGTIGSGEYNGDPARNASSAYPLLPDPPHSGINQAYADYTGLPATRLRLGRQILRIDDQRFISDVDFRQTPQVFDGVMLTNTALPETEIQLGEFRRIRTVLGRLNPLRLHILHVAWNPLPEHSLAAYGYWHDQAATGSQTGFANSAQRIAGAHAEGGFALGEVLRGMYYLGYARQARIGGGDARIKADYSRVGVGVQTTGASIWGVRLDHEVKGSNRGVYGFQTPLTDFYAFNGTALQYTSTPREGLRDTWFTARGHLDRLECFVEAHRFRSDFGGLALGREFDASVSWPFTHSLNAKLQHARFRAGDGARVKNDVDKTWLALTYIY
ncbi:MAG: alginate export family protein [Betaproteobacteria bacterium]